jgi:hypothetical protein
MYGIDGRHDAAEESLPHSRGTGLAPVRVGNAATPTPARHLRRADGLDLPLRQVRRADLVRPLDQRDAASSTGSAATGEMPDEGIWEVRGGRQEFLFSRFMCWAAIDRGRRLATSARFPRRSNSGARCANEIYSDVSTTSGTRSGAARAVQGEPDPGRISLLMPLGQVHRPHPTRAGYPPARHRGDLVDDSLSIATAHASSADGPVGRGGHVRHLLVLVHRCCAAGEWTRRATSFEKIARLRESTRALPEELGPAGEHLGNFRRRSTHLGLISAAHYLRPGSCPRAAAPGLSSGFRFAHPRYQRRRSGPRPSSIGHLRVVAESSAAPRASTLREGLLGRRRVAARLGRRRASLPSASAMGLIQPRQRTTAWLLPRL